MPQFKPVIPHDPQIDKRHPAPVDQRRQPIDDERYPGSFFRIPGVPTPGKTTWSLTQ